MKRIRKAILSIPVIFLYCVLVIQYSNNKGSISSEHPSGKDNYHSFVYDNLFTLSRQTEESLFNTNKTPQTSLKNLFNKSVSFSQSVESLWTSSFSRYLFWSQNATIRLLKLVIIFPFHSFW
jgi:hypothetical protein